MNVEWKKASFFFIYWPLVFKGVTQSTSWAQHESAENKPPALQIHTALWGWTVSVVFWFVTSLFQFSLITLEMSAVCFRPSQAAVFSKKSWLNPTCLDWNESGGSFIIQSRAVLVYVFDILTKNTGISKDHIRLAFATLLSKDLELLKWNTH